MKQKRFNHAVLSAAALILPITAWSADLDLKVENVKGTSGHLRVAVYGSSADYRKTPVKAIKAAAVSDPVSIRIAGLEAGDYAIALFHDRNGNEKLDSNLMGIPTEPYGFSGSTRNLMGPAKWEQARFTVAPEGGTITVRLSD
ncbi:MAG TPA: DUF2141 domain-containing protein [Lautropia sp.]|nr:DUF2141 domain-containing protein [Lautropia sp.]